MPIAAISLGRTLVACRTVEEGRLLEKPRPAQFLSMDRPGLQRHPWLSPRRAAEVSGFSLAAWCLHFVR